MFLPPNATAAPEVVITSEPANESPNSSVNGQSLRSLGETSSNNDSSSLRRLNHRKHKEKSETGEEEAAEEEDNGEGSDTSSVDSSWVDRSDSTSTNSSLEAEGLLSLNLPGPVVFPNLGSPLLDLAAIVQVDTVTVRLDADDLWQAALARATELHENGEFAESLTWYANAAREGSPTALHIIGLALRHGWGVPVDAAQGFRFLEKAASAPYAPALCDLALSYRFGWGTRRNQTKVAECFLQGAEMGDKDCMAELGQLYMDGKGVKRSKYHAAYWFKKAESLGFEQPNQQWIHKKKYEDVDVTQKPKSGSSSHLEVPGKKSSMQSFFSSLLTPKKK